MAVERHLEDGIATLTIDDGKANALDVGLFEELDEAFDACRDDAAVVIAGREGMFSAGLNTRALGSLDDDGLAELLTAFGRTFLRIWLEPRPVVAAVTGHAIAGGTILAMVADQALAADGDFRWGLTETSIGFPMPAWVIAVGRGNVRPDRFDDLVLGGTLLPPEEAVEAGFADAVVRPDAVLAEAASRARARAELPATAYAETKRRLRGPAAEEALAGLEADARAVVAAR